MHYAIYGFTPFPVALQHIRLEGTPKCYVTLRVPPLLYHDDCKRLPLKSLQVGQSVRCIGWPPRRLYNTVYQANRQAEVLNKHTRCYEFLPDDRDPDSGVIKRLF